MRKTVFLLCFIFSIFLVTPMVSADINQAQYYFIIEENGNTIVAITFEGNGEIEMELQEDVEEFEIEGALYIREGSSLTVATGATEKAVLVYKTALLTQKSGETWEFAANLETLTDKQVIIAMPEKTVIKNTIPSGLVEQEEITKITFNNPTQILIEYEFPNVLEEANEVQPTQEKSVNPILIILGSLSIIFIVIIIGLNTYKPKQLKARQEQILQTLTENEKSIVQTIINSRKSYVKRSYIERKLKIAKSSLAATLTNLERKKIIDIDKTYHSHNIKLTDWFKKL